MAKEKANQMVMKFFNSSDYWIEIGGMNLAKECALICADEMINILKKPLIGDEICKENINEEICFLKEVKKEIQKL